MLSPVGFQFGWEAAKGNVAPMAHLEAFDMFTKYPEGPCAEDRWISLFGADNGMFMPRHERWTEINTKLISPEMDLILRREKPAAEALPALAEQVTAAFTGS